MVLARQCACHFLDVGFLSRVFDSKPCMLHLLRATVGQIRRSGDVLSPDAEGLKAVAGRRNPPDV